MLTVQQVQETLDGLFTSWGEFDAAKFRAVLPTIDEAKAIDAQNLSDEQCRAIVDAIKFFLWRDQVEKEPLDKQFGSIIIVMESAYDAILDGNYHVMDDAEEREAKELVERAKELAYSLDFLIRVYEEPQFCLHRAQFFADAVRDVRFDQKEFNRQLRQYLKFASSIFE